MIFCNQKNQKYIKFIKKMTKLINNFYHNSSQSMEFLNLQPNNKDNSISINNNNINKLL